jgi:hypothetical protein
MYVNIIKKNNAVYNPGQYQVMYGISGKLPLFLFLTMRKICA